MSYLDKHKDFMNVYGNSVADQRKNTTSSFMTSSFMDSPFYKVVTVDGVQKDARIEDMTSIIRSNNFQTILFTNKYMILKPNDSANLGAIVEFDGLSWLMTDYNTNDSIFPKGKIEKCNNSLSVITGETETDTGKVDNYGEPITITTPTVVNLPCILRGHLASVNLNYEVNQPADHVEVTVQYNDTSKLIKEDDVYTFYDRKYKVKSLDFTNVFNGVGFMTFVADRDVS